MKRPYILAECTWKEIKERMFDLAILPWGACEAHNYHLPYATDIIEADHIAAESSRKAYESGSKVIVLPTIPFGVNTGQTDIALDMNIYPSTQFSILNDTIEVLRRSQINKLLVLNSHGGNDFRTILRELGVRYPDMLLTSCDWFKALDRKSYFENDGDHAEEMETSLILHLAPDLARELQDAGPGKERKIKIQGINEGWAWAERRWSQVTADTGIGSPALATSEKGQIFFNDVTDKIAQLISELCVLDMTDMYEDPQ